MLKDSFQKDCFKMSSIHDVTDKLEYVQVFLLLPSTPIH